MNIQVFLFKLLMSLYYVMRLSLLFAPVTILSVYGKQGGWKYGFTFIQNSLEVGLFMAFAMGFMLGMYHVLSFEIVGKGPLEYYLRSNQRLHVRSSKTLEELVNFLKSDKRYVRIKVENGTVSFERKVIFSPPDRMSAQLKDGVFELSSRPRFKWWFIDFGRNFKHLKQLAVFLKRT